MGKPKLKVFISCNEDDREFAEKLKNTLQEHKIHVIDIDSGKFGDKREDFIDQSVRETAYTIPIVSEHSLRDPWFIMQVLDTLRHAHVNRQKKLLPVRIDQALSNVRLPITIAHDIDTEINKLKRQREEADNRKLKTGWYNTQIERFEESRGSIDDLLSELDGSFVADFSSKEKFQENLQRLLKSIEVTAAATHTNASLWASFAVLLLLIGTMFGVLFLFRSPMNTLIESSAGNFRTLIMVGIAFVLSLIVAVIMFGIMRNSTAEIKPVGWKIGYSKTSGPIAGFLITFIILLSVLLPQPNALRLVGNVRLVENGKLVGVAREAKIAIANHPEIGPTETDNNGNFQLSFPQDFPQQTIDIQVTYEGNTTFRTVQRTDFGNVKIELER